MADLGTAIISVAESGSTVMATNYSLGPSLSYGEAFVPSGGSGGGSSAPTGNVKYKHPDGSWRPLGT